MWPIFVVIWKFTRVQIADSDYRTSQVISDDNDKITIRKVHFLESPTQLKKHGEFDLRKEEGRENKLPLASIPRFPIVVGFIRRSTAVRTRK